MNYKIQLVIASLCFVIACIMLFDIVVYTFKNAPKTSTFTKRQWAYGVVFAAVTVFFIFNGFKFV